MWTRDSQSLPSLSVVNNILMLYIFHFISPICACCVSLQFTGNDGIHRTLDPKNSCSKKYHNSVSIYITKYAHSSGQVQIAYFGIWVFYNWVCVHFINRNCYGSGSLGLQLLSWFWSFILLSIGALDIHFLLQPI